MSHRAPHRGAHTASRAARRARLLDLILITHVASLSALCPALASPASPSVEESAAPLTLSPEGEEALGALGALDSRDELSWSPSLMSAAAAVKAARRAAELGAAEGGAPRRARPHTAEECAAGWREGDEEARAAWGGLKADATRAWELGAEGEPAADWLERMGRRGPRPLSHTWPGGAAGFLLNAPQLEQSPLWIARRYTSYATPELLTGVRAGVYALREAHPDSPRLVLGDLSARFGGHLPPHLSHQSGRDADIGYFMRGALGKRLTGLALVSARTIDVPRTWAFLHGMLKTGLLESAFIDYRLQRVLYKHAQASGVPAERLKEWFSFPLWKGGVISHLKGHADHMHVRFKAPSSEARGAELVRAQGRGALKPRPRFTRAKGGERLEQLARRYRVPVRALSRWNGLRAQAKLPKGRLVIVGYSTPWQAVALLRSGRLSEVTR